MQTVASEPALQKRLPTSRTSLSSGFADPEMIYITTGLNRGEPEQHRRSGEQKSVRQGRRPSGSPRTAFSALLSRTDNSWSGWIIARRSKPWLSPDTTSADDVYATLLNAELDTSEKIYSIYVIAEADALEVFMLNVPCRD